MELSSLRTVIEKFDLSPRKNLGQNFLLDLNITNKIVQAAGSVEGKNILEIGPGPGGLTRSILAANPKKLTVIEQDIRCINAMDELVIAYPGKLEVLHADALKIKEEELSGGKLKIIANLPYNIGTVLLCKWLDRIDLWQDMTLMFQKEVAERIVAKPGTKDYGRLAVLSQMLCITQLHFELNPQAFYPPPKVTSTVISLYPREEKVPMEIVRAVQLICKAVFNQRRKMLRSSLKQVHKDLDALIHNTDISLSQRPEELTVEQYKQLAANYIRLLIPCPS